MFIKLNNYRKKNALPFQVTAFFVIGSFISTLIMPPSARAQSAPLGLNLPLPGTMVALSPGFFPPVLRGLIVYPDKPFHFDFIVDAGESGIIGDELKEESSKLIKYFLAALTVPEKDLWVNLSPYEKERIIPESFGATEMGRDLLAQDYLLKQLTASLIYPEEELGREFWDKVYAKAQQLYGTSDIPVNTFNKVWIVPQKAVVYENENTAFVTESRLKVLLESDYLALKENLQDKTTTARLTTEHVKELSDVSSAIIREVIIPAIEKEVNEGDNFAKLRQVYHSLILAAWFKRTLKESFLGRMYMDKNKVLGIELEDKAVKDKIYEQYLTAFKKGVYDYVKEDYNPATQEVIARQYFSGGFTAMGMAEDPNTLEVRKTADDPEEFDEALGQLKDNGPLNLSILGIDVNPLQARQAGDPGNKGARDIKSKEDNPDSTGGGASGQVSISARQQQDFQVWLLDYLDDIDEEALDFEVVRALILLRKPFAWINEGLLDAMLKEALKDSEIRNHNKFSGANLKYPNEMAVRRELKHRLENNLENNPKALQQAEKNGGDKSLYLAAIRDGVDLPRKREDLYKSKEDVEQALARRESAGLENNPNALKKPKSEEGDYSLYRKALEFGIDLPNIRAKGYASKEDVILALAQRDKEGLPNNALALQKLKSEGGDAALYRAAQKFGIELPRRKKKSASQRPDTKRQYFSSSSRSRERQHGFSGDERQYENRYPQQLITALAKRESSQEGPILILDIGMATGEISLWTLKQNTNYRVFGIDLEPSLVQSANTKARDRGISLVEERDFKEAVDALRSSKEPMAAFRVLDILTEEIPFDEFTFDAVMVHRMRDGVLNPKDRERLQKNIGRLVKPGGWVSIIEDMKIERNDPNGEWFQRRYQFHQRLTELLKEENLLPDNYVDVSEDPDFFHVISFLDKDARPLNFDITDYIGREEIVVDKIKKSEWIIRGIGLHETARHVIESFNVNGFEIEDQWYSYVENKEIPDTVLKGMLFQKESGQQGGDGMMDVINQYLTDSGQGELFSVVESLSQTIGPEYILKAFTQSSVIFAFGIEKLSNKMPEVRKLAEIIGAAPLEERFAKDPLEFANGITALSRIISTVDELASLIEVGRIAEGFTKNPMEFSGGIALLSEKMDVLRQLVGADLLGKEKVGSAFAQHPHGFSFAVSLINDIESLQQFIDGGDIDINEMLRQNKQRIIFESYEVASLNAAEGLIKILGIAPEYVTIEYDEEIDKSLAKTRFPEEQGYRIVSEVNNEKGIKIRFKDAGAVFWENGKIRMLYSPLKYILPQPLTVETINDIKNKIGLKNGRKMIVVSSPTDYEVIKVLKAYENYEEESRPLLILGMRKENEIIEGNIRSAFPNSLVRDNRHQVNGFDGYAEGRKMGEADIVVLNTRGELLELIGAADVSIVGHDRNIWEPVSQGQTPLFFPGDWRTNKEAVQFLENRGAAIEIVIEELYDQIEGLIRHGDIARANAQRALDEFNETVVPASKICSALAIAAIISRQADENKSYAGGDGMKMTENILMPGGKVEFQQEFPGVQAKLLQFLQLDSVNKIKKYSKESIPGEPNVFKHTLILEDNDKKIVFFTKLELDEHAVNMSWIAGQSGVGPKSFGFNGKDGWMLFTLQARGKALKDVAIPDKAVALQITQAIGSALGSLHGDGILHDDLSAFKTIMQRHIFVDEVDGKYSVQIIDYGFSLLQNETYLAREKAAVLTQLLDGIIAEKYQYPSGLFRDELSSAYNEAYESAFTGRHPVETDGADVRIAADQDGDTFNQTGSVDDNITWAEVMAEGYEAVAEEFSKQSPGVKKISIKMLHNGKELPDQMISAFKNEYLKVIIFDLFFPEFPSGEMDTHRPGRGRALIQHIRELYPDYDVAFTDAQTPLIAAVDKMALALKEKWDDGQVFKERLLKETRDMPQGQITVDERRSLQNLIGDISLYLPRVNKPQPTNNPVGGIDFDPALIDLQRRGNINPIPIPDDPAEFLNLQFDGLVPVIININVLPVSQLPFVLGLNHAPKIEKEMSIVKSD